MFIVDVDLEQWVPSRTSVANGTPIGLTFVNYREKLDFSKKFLKEKYLLEDFADNLGKQYPWQRLELLPTITLSRASYSSNRLLFL